MHALHCFFSHVTLIISGTTGLSGSLLQREKLPQSFSPPHLKKDNNNNNNNNVEDNKQNMVDKADDIDSKKFSCDQVGVDKNLPLLENKNEDEGFLTIWLRRGKLKACRTGRFKPYKICLMEAKENRVGTTSNQSEEKGPKRIHLEGEAPT